VKAVTAKIQIDASSMVVWAILTDLPSYQDWNPLFPEASGEVVAGRRIALRARQPGSGRLMRIKPRIITAAPGAELRWVASVPGVMGGEHSFVLTPADGGTLLVQAETFTGVLSSFAGKTIAAAEGSFADLNQALKKRAEAVR
jgi:hypothetical protein